MHYFNHKIRPSALHFSIHLSIPPIIYAPCYARSWGVAQCPSLILCIFWAYWQAGGGVLQQVLIKWLPRWLSGKESACKHRRCGFDSWAGKIPWMRKWQPTPVFLPGKFHGQRRLKGCSPQGHKESDMPEHPCGSAMVQNQTLFY